MDVLFRSATFSKGPEFWGRDFQPNEVLKGVGSRVLCGDGVWRIDYVSALGANLLGYGHPEFCRRVAAQIWEGAGFSLPHPLEDQVAHRIVDMLQSRVPGWATCDLGLRFGKTGSDACNMAIRIAKAVTGRKRILSSGFHGWLDAYVSITPPAWGVTQPQYVENWDLKQADWENQLFTDEPPAAVILEAPIEGFSDGFGVYLRGLCNQVGALLILDEVVTNLRMGLGGAAELYGVEPDMVTMGKAIANTLPLSCVVGRREYFNFAFNRFDPVFISSTSFGEAVALQGANCVLDIWNDEAVKDLWTIGTALMDGLRAVGYDLIGNGPRMLIQFPTLAHKAYFTLGMRDRQILWNRPTLPNLSHSMSDVAMTIKAAQEIKAEMEKIDVQELMKDRLPIVLFEGR